MFYREAGQFKTSYKADQALFPILQDRIGMVVILVIAFVAIPLLANDFFLTSIMIPFLIFALAAIGLNILTGFCGQLSLGTGAFMGVGAYAAYKLTSIFPDANVILMDDEHLSGCQRHPDGAAVGGLFRRHRRGLRPAEPAH